MSTDIASVLSVISFITEISASNTNYTEAVVGFIEGNPMLIPVCSLHDSVVGGSSTSILRITFLIIDGVCDDFFRKFLILDSEFL